MTILTGDFAADPQMAQLPLPATETALATPGQAAGTAEDATGEMSEDARLYLRHVEGGETIRALAREAGCHASTILRRIRRLEARRDDPLVDAALARRAAAAAPEAAAAARSDELRRVLRRLAEAGAQLAVAPGMEKAIITRDEIRTAILDRSLAESLALNGWVTLIGGGRMSLYAISSLGRDALRDMLRGRPVPMPRATDLAGAEPVGMAEDAVPFRHLDHEERVIIDPEDGRRRRARFNIAESPLQVLARRRDRDGAAFLSAGQVAAGERLREDFELAQMGPRTTQNWHRFLTAGVDAGRGTRGWGGGSEGARSRVAAALRDLGPGMGDLVLRVCCFLEGIEQTEQRLGWSARSGKIVLRLALMRLDRHYRETYGQGSPLIG